MRANRLQRTAPVKAGIRKSGSGDEAIRRLPGGSRSHARQRDQKDPTVRDCVTRRNESTRRHGDCRPHDAEGTGQAKCGPTSLEARSISVVPSWTASAIPVLPGVLPESSESLIINQKSSISNRSSAFRPPPSALFLSTPHSPLSTLHYPLSTIHYPPPFRASFRHLRPLRGCKSAVSWWKFSAELLTPLDFLVRWSVTGTGVFQPFFRLLAGRPATLP